METTTALLIAIPIIIVLAAVVLLASARRRDTGQAIGMLSRETRKRDRGPVQVEDEEVPATGRELELAAAIARRGGGTDVVRATSAPPVAWVPPDEDLLGVTRRQFLNRGIVVGWIVGLSGFGAACLAFIWPKLGGGFGAKLTLRMSDIDAKITDGDGFAYYPEGRMWITHYPSGAIPKAQAVYSPSELAGMEAGYIALYQKCVHLGCRVPSCPSSQWFECGCHGSQYNQAGEKKGGPAPRGLDRFAMSVSGSNLTVDTAQIIQGPPIGTNTTGQEAQGPHCVGGASH